jgi:hypothetical protein
MKGIQKKGEKWETEEEMEMNNMRDTVDKGRRRDTTGGKDRIRQLVEEKQQEEKKKKGDKVYD